MRSADFENGVGKRVRGFLWEVVNTRPLTVDNLRGKVVLVDFWTYTCINWLRTLAYVRASAEKYRDRGLVVVGAHTPEFPFEQNVDNVCQAANDMNVWYPIALDSDYEVWRAFERLRIPVPDGRLMSVELRFGDSTVMLADEFPEMGSSRRRRSAAPTWRSI